MIPLRHLSLCLVLIQTLAGATLGGCSSSVRLEHQGLETSQLQREVAQLRTLAVPSDGQDLAAELGRNLAWRGLVVQWLSLAHDRPQDRWPDASAPIDHAALEAMRRLHQSDALLEVRSSQGFDGELLLAQVRLLRTPQAGQSGRLLSEVTWRNRSLGNGPGNTLHRLGRKGTEEAVREIVPLLLEGPPPPVR